MSYLAVLVAAIVYMALGALWYSPKAFGKIWVELAGLKPEDCTKEKAREGFAFASVCALGLGFVLLHFVRSTGTEGLWDGLKLGLRIGVGLLGFTTLPTYIFSNRPKRLFLIDVGYPATAILLMCGLLAAWPQDL